MSPRRTGLPAWCRRCQKSGPQPGLPGRQKITMPCKAAWPLTPRSSCPKALLCWSRGQATPGGERTEGFLMPDNVETGSQSTVPLVSMTDGRAMVRLNRPREHNRLEPSDLAVLRKTFDRVDLDPSVHAWC